jgi:hypothetical protein
VQSDRDRANPQRRGKAAIFGINRPTCKFKSINPRIQLQIVVKNRGNRDRFWNSAFQFFLFHKERDRTLAIVISSKLAWMTCRSFREFRQASRWVNFSDTTDWMPALVGDPSPGFSEIHQGIGDFFLHILPL